ncbi:ABC transporter substrate-binding protein [Numidum massiliense]|uniref:ABC transporter substrate-binding protein n=1 Tax=Numidum massiliense TaxID=1522315 RepID=UPI0006D5A16D|nr:ABC transporter substrate-binding protein [Numidum massiliense]
MFKSKRWNRWSLFLTALLVFALLIGCGAPEADEQAKGANDGSNVEQQAGKQDGKQGAAQQKGKQKSKEEDAQAEGSFPVSITDARDEKVTIEKRPQRIVSLIPSNTEIAFALGLGAEVVGVSDFDNYPEEVSSKEKIGGIEFDVEKIVSLKPDLVLAHASSADSAKEGLKQLQQAGATVLVVNDATTFADLYRSIEMIAEATGTKAKAQEIVAGMKEKLDDMKREAEKIAADERVTVWVEVAAPPEMYTTGTETFMHEMLTAINATNAAGDVEGWAKFTEEDAVKQNPDVIVTTYGDYDKEAKKKILARKAWQDVPAVKHKRVYDVDPDTVTRPGPRLIEGVEQLAAVVYPDVFKKKK